MTGSEMSFHILRGSSLPTSLYLKALRATVPRHTQGESRNSSVLENRSLEYESVYFESA